MAAVGAAPVGVHQMPANNGHPGGFDVSYRSPTEGQMTFGWNAPLTVAGRTIALHGTRRFDDPFISEPVGSQLYAIRNGISKLTLDFAHNRREAQ